MKDLTIVIPTYNRQALLDKCLESFISKIDSNIEVIVIDNNSEDETSQVAAKYKNFDNFVYHKNPQNVGGGRSVFIGFMIAKSDNIMFMGDDDKLEISYINEVLNISKNNDYGMISFYENENLEEIKQFTKGDIAVSNCFMRSGVLPGLVINRKYMDLAKIPLNEIIYPQVFSAIHVSLNADMFLVSSASKIVKIDYFSNFNIEDRSADRPGDYGVFERIFYIRENYKMNLVSKSVYYSNLKALFIWSKNVWKLKNSFESQKAYSFYKELIRSREVVRNRHFLKLYFMDTIIREDVSYLLKFKYFFSTFYYLIFSKEIRR